MHMVEVAGCAAALPVDWAWVLSEMRLLVRDFVVQAEAVGGDSGTANSTSATGTYAKSAAKNLIAAALVLDVFVTAVRGTAEQRTSENGGRAKLLPLLPFVLRTCHQVLERPNIVEQCGKDILALLRGVLLQSHLLAQAAVANDVRLLADLLLRAGTAVPATDAGSEGTAPRTSASAASNSNVVASRRAPVPLDFLTALEALVRALPRDVWTGGTLERDFGAPPGGGDDDEAGIIGGEDEGSGLLGPQGGANARSRGHAPSSPGVVSTDDFSRMGVAACLPLTRVLSATVSWLASQGVDVFGHLDWSRGSRGALWREQLGEASAAHRELRERLTRSNGTSDALASTARWISAIDAAQDDAAAIEEAAATSLLLPTLLPRSARAPGGAAAEAAAEAASAAAAASAALPTSSAPRAVNMPFLPVRSATDCLCVLLTIIAHLLAARGATAHAVLRTPPAIALVAFVCRGRQWAVLFADARRLRRAALRFLITVHEASAGGYAAERGQAGMHEAGLAAAHAGAYASPAAGAPRGGLLRMAGLHCLPLLLFSGSAGEEAAFFDAPQTPSLVPPLPAAAAVWTPLHCGTAACLPYFLSPLNSLTPASLPAALLGTAAMLTPRLHAGAQPDAWLPHTLALATILLAPGTLRREAFRAFTGGTTGGATGSASGSGSVSVAASTVIRGSGGGEAATSGLGYSGGLAGIAGADDGDGDGVDASLYEEATILGSWDYLTLAADTMYYCAAAAAALALDAAGGGLPGVAAPGCAAGDDNADAILAQRSKSAAVASLTAGDALSGYGRLFPAAFGACGDAPAATAAAVAAARHVARRGVKPSTTALLRAVRWGSSATAASSKHADDMNTSLAGGARVTEASDDDAALHMSDSEAYISMNAGAALGSTLPMRGLGVASAGASASALPLTHAGAPTTALAAASSPPLLVFPLLLHSLCAAPRLGETAAAPSVASLELMLSAVRRHPDLLPHGAPTAALVHALTTVALSGGEAARCSRNAIQATLRLLLTLADAAVGCGRVAVGSALSEWGGTSSGAVAARAGTGGAAPAVGYAATLALAADDALVLLPWCARFARFRMRASHLALCSV